MITLADTAPEQLDLFAEEATDDGAVVDWDSLVPFRHAWGSRDRGPTCGRCRWFVLSSSRPGFDGYCSALAFEPDPRPSDGTGWHFYGVDQPCTVAP